MSQFIVHALPAGEPDAAAPTGTDDDADGPQPCRRCLRNAEIGDPLRLLPYDPFRLESPYTGEGPVFVHAHECTPHSAAAGELPEQVHGRTFSVRAYDERAMMLGADVVPGDALAARAEELLADGAAFLHAHFAGPGCFAFRIDRA
jgi:hypothetical protein